MAFISLRFIRPDAQALASELKLLPGVSPHLETQFYFFDTVPDWHKQTQVLKVFTTCTQVKVRQARF